MTNGTATIHKFNEWKSLMDFLSGLKSTCQVHITRDKGEWNVSVDQPAAENIMKPKIAIGVALYDLYW